MPTELVEIGLIGCGFIAELHREALERISGVKIASVFDQDGSRAAEFAARSGARVVSDPRAIFDDEAVDVVYVLTRHDSHVDYVVKAAEAGKAVFCEKPLSLTVEGATDVVRKVRETGIPLMVGFNLRWSPAVRRAKELADQQEGKLRALELTFVTTPFLDGWAGLPEEGGGVVHCLGSHALDLAFHLMAYERARIVAVEARLRLREPYLSDTGAVLIQPHDGPPTTLLFHDHAPKSYPHYETGEQSHLVHATLFGDGWVVAIDDLSHVRLFTEGKVKKISTGRIDRVERLGFLGENRHFLDCVRSGCRPRPDENDGARVVGLVAAATRSAKSGKFVAWDGAPSERNESPKGD